MKKRLFTVVLALVLALSFSSTAFAASAADQIVEEANLKLLAAESYAMDMELALEMAMAGESVVMDMDCEAAVLTDPDKLKMDMVVTVEAAGEKETIKMPMYVIQEEDGVCIAMKVEGEWQHMDLPVTDFLEGDPMGLDTMGSFTGVSGYYKSANANVNGRPAGRYTARLYWDEYAELFESFDFASLFAEVEMTEEEAAEFDVFMDELLGMSFGAMMAGMFEDMDPTEVHLYIDDETGLPIRYEADMALAVEQLVANMLETLLEGFGATNAEVKEAMKEMDLSIDRYDLVMKIYDVGEVKDFKLPSGAKH